MKRSVLGLLCIAAITSAAVAGTETYSVKEMKQVAPPLCPQWYADNEFNGSLWGTYVFTGNNLQEDYLGADHAWGGGVDLKYFFHRYFGVGIEGWATESTRGQFDGFDFNGQPVFSEDSRVIGATKGTFTLRYPIHCSRLSPYIFGGSGAIFGGGERDSFVELI